MTHLEPNPHSSKAPLGNQAYAVMLDDMASVLRMG
jgi:hypothetical protein